MPSSLINAKFPEKKDFFRSQRRSATCGLLFSCENAGIDFLRNIRHYTRCYSAFISEMIIFERRVVTICTTIVRMQKHSNLPTDCVYVFCVVSTTKRLFSAKIIRLDLALEMECVYCAVRAES